MSALVVEKIIEVEVIRNLGVDFCGTWFNVGKQVKSQGLGVGIVIDDLHALGHFIALIGSDHHFLCLLLKF